MLAVATEAFVNVRSSRKHELGLSEVHSLLQAMVFNLEATRPDTSCAPLLQQAALCCCRVAGRSKDFGTALEAAETVLRGGVYNAPACGYKGYAEFKLGRYAEVLTSLERAQVLFGKKHRQSQQVEDCIIACCLALGRKLPFPPLVKFPRTAHLFRPQKGSKL